MTPIPGVIAPQTPLSRQPPLILAVAVVAGRLAGASVNFYFHALPTVAWVTFVALLAAEYMVVDDERPASNFGATAFTQNPIIWV